MDFITHRQELLEEHMTHRSGAKFVHDYAELMDRFLQDLCHQKLASGSSPAPLALAALGGYGRKELAPWSDVDLLFLSRTTADQATYRGAIESVLYPLWDLKLDVGHAVRTPTQGVDLAREDFTALSTQLEARFLAGDRALFDEFEAGLRRWLGAKATRQHFFRELKTSATTRHRKYGDSPYRLEPNVKEGPGGLRDIQAIHWAATALYERRLETLVEKGLLAADRLSELDETRAFMTEVRVHLHILAGERTDTLTFELQEGVASVLGYQDNGHYSAVERFMRDYHTHVYRTKSALDYFLSRLQEELTPGGVWRMTQMPRRVEKGLTILRGKVELSGRAEIVQRPAIMMRAFEVSSASGLPMSQRSLELIRTNLDLIDDRFRRDPRIMVSFFRALTAVPPPGSRRSEPLDPTQGLELLMAYLPELAAVRAQVQHDAYHVYTVDVHQMVTVQELKNTALGLAEGGTFDQQVFEQTRDKRLLFLAALLHDLGKGRGPDHARVGAELMPAIGTRLGLTSMECETLAFLVAQHLYLVHVATRRDMSEEKLIVDCARKIGDEDRLNMLYLLTMADSRATGPTVMTPWKCALIRELYSKIHRVLTKSDLAQRGAAEKTDRLLLKVVKSLENHGLTADEIDSHLETLSAYYLSVITGTDQVVRHILLERELAPDHPLVWRVETKKEGHREVTMAAQDRPGFLSRMAGVFTLHHINILGAQVFTRSNNVALDVFQVGQPPDLEFEDQIWERVRRDAERVLAGHLALDFRLSQMRPLLNSGLTRPVTRVPNKVVVDNETSDFYTIVEVFTYDRLGLLYEITKTLFDLQLSIHRAMISTKVEQVVDVFYVRDSLGEKVTSEEQIAELNDALMFTLNK